MSKKVQVKSSAKKTNAKKTSKHVEAKPLMSLEEAREVLKKHVAMDTEEGAERIALNADQELADVVKNNLKFFSTADYESSYEWHTAMRKAVKRISDAVELVIAAETNLNLSTFTA